jgi:hypothetical protein
MECSQTVIKEKGVGSLQGSSGVGLDKEGKEGLVH